MARPRWLTRYARLPIRARLTIAFIAVMAIVLATAGVVLYGQFAHDLDADINSSLDAQAVDVAALVEGRGPQAVHVSGQRLAQVYSADGRVLATTEAARGLRLLTVDQARAAAHGTLRIKRRTVASSNLRVRAVPARRGDDEAVAVAVSLEQRDDELSRLRTRLGIAGPLALLLASLAGYELAGAALRPVDRMRGRAEQITESQLSERLPVPHTNDEIEALGRTLNDLLDRVEAAVARERRLVSDASHELRTPLTTLRAEVDLALRGERDPEELRAALTSAAEEAERMTRLADDLLVLARADQGRLPLNPQSITTHELLQDAATRAGAAARALGREIVVNGDAGAAAVLADRDRAAQALDNLVTNALRYGEGKIELSAQGDGDLVELHVADEGRGFPDDIIDHAFERFGRGNEARAGGSGSGLGLSIVEVVARAHGGRAGVRNRPQGGADAWIGLPRA